MKLTSSHFANSPEPIPVTDCCLFSVVLPDLHPLTSLTLVAQLTAAIPLPLLPAQSKTPRVPTEGVEERKESALARAFLRNVSHSREGCSVSNHNQICKAD